MFTHICMVRKLGIEYTKATRKFWSPLPFLPLPLPLRLLRIRVTHTADGSRQSLRSPRETTSYWTLTTKTVAALCVSLSMCVCNDSARNWNHFLSKHFFRQPWLLKNYATPLIPDHRPSLDCSWLVAMIRKSADPACENKCNRNRME